MKSELKHKPMARVSSHYPLRLRLVRDDGFSQEIGTWKLSDPTHALSMSENSMKLPQREQLRISAIVDLLQRTNIQFLLLQVIQPTDRIQPWRTKLIETLNTERDQWEIFSKAVDHPRSLKTKLQLITLCRKSSKQQYQPSNINLNISPNLYLHIQIKGTEDSGLGDVSLINFHQWKDEFRAHGGSSQQTNWHRLCDSIDANTIAFIGGATGVTPKLMSGDPNYFPRADIGGKIHVTRSLGTVTELTTDGFGIINAPWSSKRMSITTQKLTAFNGGYVLKFTTENEALYAVNELRSNQSVPSFMVDQSDDVWHIYLTYVEFSTLSKIIAELPNQLLAVSDSSSTSSDEFSS